MPSLSEKTIFSRQFSEWLLSHRTNDCSILWAHGIQNFAVRLISVLLAAGYIPLMQTATKDDLGHFQRYAEFLQIR